MASAIPEAFFKNCLLCFLIISCLFSAVGLGGLFISSHSQQDGLRHVLCCLRVCFIGLLFLCSGCFQMLFSKADRLLGLIFSLASWCNSQPACLGFVLLSGFAGHAEACSA